MFLWWIPKKINEKTGFEKTENEEEEELEDHDSVTLVKLKYTSSSKVNKQDEPNEGSDLSGSDYNRLEPGEESVPYFDTEKAICPSPEDDDLSE